MGVNSVIDLTPAQRRSILRLIEAHLPRTDVWAYGSRMKWTSQPASDLDLVAFAGPDQKHQVANLREAFEESNLPFRVDLLVWDEIPESFQEEIDAEHAALVEWTPGAQSWCTLGDLADITMGQSPPGATVNGKTGMPLLNGPTEFGPHHPTPRQYTLDPRKIARRGDLLFCVRGSTTGRMNWADREYAIGRGIAAIRHRTREGLQPFVRAVIESRLAILLAGATGSVFRNVSATELTDLPIPDLPLKRQSEIAHVLGTLDARMELNRQMCDTLEAMIRAIYKDWFVDFGPVRAKMEGCKPYLPYDLWDSLPLAVDAQGLPEGWRPWTVADLARHHRSSVSPAQNPEVLFEHYSIPAYDADQAPLLELGASIRSNKTIVPRDSVLLSKLNPVVARVWIPAAPCYGLPVCSTEFLALTPRRPASLALLYCLFLNTRFRQMMEGMVTGTSKSHQRVSPTALLSRTVLYADPAVMRAYDRQASPLLARLVRYRTRLSLISAIRDTLLPFLFAGPVGAPDSAAAIASAATLDPPTLRRTTTNPSAAVGG